MQIAPYVYGNENPTVLAEFWEAQSAAFEIPNTGMVVLNDIGNYKNIHPTNKQEVGRRLALLALKNVYGQSSLVASGPTFKAMAIEGDKIRIRFDNVGGGLASRDGRPLSWFEIIGKDTDWTKADAAIEGDSRGAFLRQGQSPRGHAFRVGQIGRAESDEQGRVACVRVSQRQGAAGWTSSR